VKSSRSCAAVRAFQALAASARAIDWSESIKCMPEALTNLFGFGLPALRTGSPLEPDGRWGWQAGSMTARAMLRCLPVDKLNVTK
jgi:hypothetical protein